MAKEIQAGQRLWIILFTDKTRVNIFISSLRGTTPQFLSTTRNSITPNPLNPIKKSPIPVYTTNSCNTRTFFDEKKSNCCVIKLSATNVK